MKKITTLALSIMVALAINPLVKAKPDHAGKGKHFKNKAKEHVSKGKDKAQKHREDLDEELDSKGQRDGRFKPNHPVFGNGKLHPVHDDKIIGKFKNADKIKERVSKIDEMDDDELETELEKTRKKIKDTREKHQDKRKKLEEIKAKRKELLEAKSKLELPQENPVGAMMNRFGLFMNDMQLNQLKANENIIQEEVSSEVQEIEESDLIKSYIEVRKAQ